MVQKHISSRGASLRKELSRETDFALARIISIIGHKASRISHKKSPDIFQYLSVLLTGLKHQEESRRVHYAQNTDPQAAPNQLVNRLLSHGVVSKQGSREFPLSKVLFEHLKMLTALRAKELQRPALDVNKPINYELRLNNDMRKLIVNVASSASPANHNITMGH